MNVIFNRLYKVDVETNTVTPEEFAENDNLDSYVMEIVSKVSEEIGDREYKFQSGAITIKSALENIIDNFDVERQCTLISNRLLMAEMEAQRKYGHLRDIQKGMLILSHVKMTDTEFKIIISKADYNTFLEEMTGQIKSGLPLKKKIFKSFIANISQGKISKIVTFDVNATVAQYWWKEFLELDSVVKDEENTIRAFNAIETKILNSIKKKSKSDYLHLWNATIAYFRGEGEFQLNHYRDNILGSYVPYSGEIEIADYVIKCNELPSQFNFDNRFIKISSAVNKRFKNVIKLSNEIDLVIK